MALTPGTQLGPYEIQAPLGAGGMGEVYRARDTRLGRDIAVKVLPQHVSATPEDRARFKREAKTISSLNHPHICVLHDVGKEGDIDYLVMELIEGETLAQRLARGALPSAEVLQLGAQIADALDRAHRAGVIHRDLKPGNVMLAKSGAKLMDFGLARASVRTGQAGEHDVTATTPASAPKSDEPITAKGTIVGTFQYMAPEQLEGKRVDARADIWALGCVLYEMATGKRAFEGSTPASLISAIMRDQPREMAELAPLTPPAFERLVLQCLAKDPDDRWQTAADLRRELQWIAGAGSQAGVATPIAAGRRRRERLAWTLAAATTVIAAGLAVIQLKPKPPAKPVIFELTPPHEVSSVDLPRISPDGRRLAFNATDSTGKAGIWVRQMNSLDAQLLPGTEGATRPFWSPDSRFMAFFSGGKLRKIDISGGPPITVCDAPRGGDGSWGSRGVILFDGTSADSVQSVWASGGIPTGATVIDRKNHETGTVWPQFLPDGRHFLYIASASPDIGTLDIGTLKVGSIDSKETKSLGPAGSRTEYASGHLLYVRGDALLAQPFDPGALKFTGDPFPVAENVETDQAGSARFSASTDGSLVYRAGGASGTDRLVWTNRRGERTGTVGGPGSYRSPALSPDGTQLAVKVFDPLRQAGDIWLWDLARDLGSRFTFADRDEYCPVWSPNGSRVVYSVARDNFLDLHIKSVGGAGADSLLFTSDQEKYAQSWSPDGRWITYMMRSPTVPHFDIYALSLGELTQPVPLVATPFDEMQPMVSPDGTWLAYVSNESGQDEVYVQSFAGSGGKWRVSTAGGIQPTWRGDSRELYYLDDAIFPRANPDRKLMVVSVSPGPPTRFSGPQELFETPLRGHLGDRNSYVVTRDGQRFMFVAPEGEGKVGVTTVVLDWLGRQEKR